MSGQPSLPDKSLPWQTIPPPTPVEMVMKTISRHRQPERDIRPRPPPAHRSPPGTAACQLRQRFQQENCASPPRLSGFNAVSTP
jgi:hypothetical protein